jgi:hypothetical protein
LIGAYASVAVLLAASLVVGQAILFLCGWRALTWLAGPVGLAALLIAAGIAVKLPGHGTTVAVVLLVLVVLSLAILVRRRWLPGADPASFRSRTARTARCMEAERLPGVHPAAAAPEHSSGAHPAAAAIAAALTLLIASLPFIVSGRVGILGVGLVNDDMASHLLIADWLNTRVGDMPGLIRHGYPVGPHALAAGLSEGLGTGLIEAFAGITLATPVITALLVVEALRGVRPFARVAVVVLVSLPYLAAAYLAQGAFKEPMVALFVLAFALLLPMAISVRRALPLAVLAAGAVYVYSFPGLFWLLATAAVYVVITLLRSRRPGRIAEGDTEDAARVRGDRAKRSLGYPAVVTGAVAVAVLVALVAPELGRLVDFTHFRAFRGDTISSGLGNLRHQLSPLEALGIWPASDFRLTAADATVPAALFYLGALVAAAAFVVGLPGWIRGHGLAVPAALVAATAIYLGALAFGTVYTSAKALAIAAPLITLVSLGGLLQRSRHPVETSPGADPTNSRSRTARTVRSMDAERSSGVHPAGALRNALALALAAGIAVSSFLVLRPAPVAPQDHADQLAELRPLVQGRKVLFLGRDNFVLYELRGSRPYTAVRNYYDPNYVQPNLRLQDVFGKFDFDSMTPSKLDRFPFVITTRAAYASGPPPTFRPLRKTRDFVLWKRAGPVGSRRTLGEGDHPGAVLGCRGGGRAKRAPGSAIVFTRQPVVGGAWAPSSTVESDGTSTQTLRVPAGRWEVSLQYDSTRAVRVRAPGLDATLPPNLDYRGSVPYYAAGTLTSPHGGPKRFQVTVEGPPLTGRLLGAKSVAHLGAIALSPVSPAGAGNSIPGVSQRRIALRHACGRYVDWFQTAR